MLRSAVAALLVLLAGLFLVGLTFSVSARGRAEFSFVNNAEPKTLDPTMMTGEPEGRVAEALFEGLTRLDAKTLEPAPGSAERWEISNEGKRYVFHLRENARWSDGHPLRAQDFSYAWRRLQDPKQGAEYAYILHMVVGAEAFNTYAAQADALLGPVTKALAELARAHPNSVPAAAFHAFSEKQQLFAATKGTPDAWLQALLAEQRPTPDAPTLARLATALTQEGQRRRREAEQAAAHFGIDRGVYATDDHTLVVELTAPTPYFLELTAFHASYPVPRWAVEAKGGQDTWFLPRKIVSNGAFRLAEWNVGDRIRLLRSDTYWGRADVKLSSADVFPVDNQTAALNLYLSGAVDWLPSNSYPVDLADYLRNRPDYYHAPALIVYYYRINCTRKPFDDLRVRKALNLAIDREQIAKEVLNLGQIPAFHLVPPGLRDYRAPDASLRYDLGEARRLLKEAGFANGRDFPAFGILYNTLESHKKLAEVLADQLHRTLGLKVSAYNQEWQAYQESVRSLNYDVARAGWVGDYEDPNTFLDLWVTNAGNNETGWGDPLYDRLIRAAAHVDTFIEAPQALLAALPHAELLQAALARTRAAVTSEQRLREAALLRLELLRSAETQLLDSGLPIIPLYFYVVSGLVKPNVKGFYTKLSQADGSTRPNPRDIHPLREIVIDANH